MDLNVLKAIESFWDYKPADRPSGHIGMSGIGHCKRQLAYVKHEVLGKPLDWRAKIIFDDGNLHHTQIRKALRDGLVLLNSCYSLVREEEEVKLGQLTGHIDGVLQHDHVRCNEDDHITMLLEVKSMNDRGFGELKRTGELSKEYAAQTSAYLRATGLKEARILAKNKNTGEMLSLSFACNDVLLDERIAALQEVYESGDAEDVAREYQSSDEGLLPWQCNYCPFVDLCWRHEGVFEKSTKKYALMTKIVDNERQLEQELSKTSSKNRRKRKKGLA